MAISRRNFLKGGAATLAALKASGATGVLAPNSKKVASICEMCSTRCPIEISVKDGKCTFISGNPKFSANKTSICARGSAGINQLYNDKRITRPLIRVGERGENRWREASWDEALSLCAEKLGEISAKYGPQAVVFTSKAGESHTQMSNFACAYGSPNIFSHWSCCPIAYNLALNHTYGAGLGRDFANAKYIVNFGHNLFEGIVISDSKKLAKFAARKDTKLLVLDPRFSVVAAKADEWLAVRPGGDAAFVMSLIHIWLRDGKYDKDFVERYTIGIDELKNSVATYDPKSQESISGIKSEIVERIADEIYRAAPAVIIDWGHKTTTTRAEYQRTRAIVIANALMGNFEKRGGIYFNKDSKTFNKLCGEELFPTLANLDGDFKVPKTPRIDGCGEEGSPYYFVPRKHGVLMQIAPAILSGKPYPIKGWVNTRFNHLINVAGTKSSVEAIKKLDFVLSIDVYLNDFSSLADVVLPEATYLERDDAIQNKSGTKPGFYMRNMAIKPIDNTKSGYEIFRELARKMGIDSAYKWSDMREYRILQAKGDDKLLAALIKDGYTSWDVPQLYYREASFVKKFVRKYPAASKFVDDDGLMSGEVKFKTKSGKIELFSSTIEERFAGEGCLNTDNIDVFDGHEFCLITGKNAVHTNGHTQYIPILNELLSEAPVWINPRAAARYGLKSGDEVVLKNRFGELRVKLFVTEGIREDTLFLYHGFGHQTPDLPLSHQKGANQSELLNPASGAVCGTMVTNVGVDIVKI